MKRMCNTCGEDQWFCEHSNREPGPVLGGILLISSVVLTIVGILSL